MSDVPGPRRSRAADYGSGFPVTAVVIVVTGVVLLNCDSHPLVRFGRQVVIPAAPGTDLADSHDGSGVPERAVISGRNPLRGAMPRR